MAQTRSIGPDYIRKRRHPRAITLRRVQEYPSEAEVGSRSIVSFLNAVNVHRWASEDTRLIVVCCGRRLRVRWPYRAGGPPIRAPLHLSAGNSRCDRAACRRTQMKLRFLIPVL